MPYPSPALLTYQNIDKRADVSKIYFTAAISVGFFEKIAGEQQIKNRSNKVAMLSIASKLIH